MKLPLLLSVPHAGGRVPAEVAGLCRLTPQEIAADSDEGAAEIYALGDAVEAFVTTDVARAIVDLNRAEDDRRADGVVKTETCLGAAVWRRYPSEARIDDLIARHHRPYHARLREIAAAGRVRLGLDGHTMLAIGPPIGPLAGRARPAICVGNADGRSCPPALLERMAECLAATFGVEVTRNRPFAGGFITREHAAELPWIQLEISRAPFASNADKRQCLGRALRRFFDGI